MSANPLANLARMRQIAGADDEARALHAQVAAAASEPAARGTHYRCSRCEGLVAVANASFDVSGNPLCETCFAGYDLRADQRRLGEAQTSLAFLAGLLLSVVGYFIFAVRGREGEVRAAAAGAIIGAFFGLIALAILH